MKKLFDFSSRFRILKGGKISLVVSAFLGGAIIANAAPSGGVVTSGNANISQSGNVTNINQSTQKASINWTNFSVASNETVNFNQPNSSSITLNRVIGNEKSVIDGALNANGQVWILNSNGILFGKNASVNTAGLLATTGELSDTDFQAGNYNFKNSSSNSVINLGTIKVQNSSYVVLAGKEVENGGTIEAIKGKVHLLGADSYSINLNGNSLVNLKVNKGVLDAMVKNSGNILANGGEIFLTTNAVDELLKGVVNNTGIIEANSLDGITGNINLSGNIIVNNGEIKATGDVGGIVNETSNMIIDAGVTDVSAVNDAGTITQNSTEILQSKSAILKANSQNAKAGNISLISNTKEQNSGIYLSGIIETKGQDGGTFATTAQKVTLNGATLNTSGTNNAGNIKIGGDWQGTKVSLENAKETNVVNSTIVNEGKDGEIVVWSDEQTNFFSTIQAPNAKAEISSKGNLNINAENVQVKSLLLDPKDIEIKDEIGLDYYLLTNPNNTLYDNFGKEVVQLSNGNYVITANGTDVGGVSNVGRVYLYSEDGQLISTLSGTHANDKVGESLNNSSITLLTNGNYVISSTSWYDARGAVTWGDANTGISGILDANNSVVGSRASDRVGRTNGNGVIALTNENYVIASRDWDNGTAVDAGAVTWVNGTTGKTNNNSGTISSSNSLVGSYSNDWVGDNLVALSNGNIATSTEKWNNNKGAATWISGTTGKTSNNSGTISSSNSIVGTNTDYVGRYLVALTNGGFVVGSPIISIDGVTQAGAATWVDGTTGKTSNNSNTISSANSIVGTTTGQFVGDGIYSISNGGYVVYANNTLDNANSYRGALRWVDSTNSSDRIGNMSNSNSLYGLTGNKLGGGGVTELPNGKYVITSSSWANGSETSAGAISLYSPSTYKRGLFTISSSNSILGSKNYDLNSSTITVLENGNYVVYSPQWKNSSGTVVGAYTFVSKDDGSIGEISSSKSLIGSNLNEFSIF